MRWRWDEDKNRRNRAKSGVVHTHPDEGGTSRLVSARKATAHERKAYEEGEF